MDQALLVLIAVSEEKNFTRAAERLHISQPAVTQHIHNLERQWSVQLFDRTQRVVRLNRAGEIAYHHAKEISALYRRMERNLEDLKQEASGPLSIAASLTFGEYVLPHVIARFRERYPKIEPSIVIENTSFVAEQVRRGEVDVGIIEGSYTASDVVVEPFARDHVTIVAAPDHPIAQVTRVTGDMLAEQTWMIREPGSGTREITDKVMGALGFRPHRVVEYGSSQIIKESVEAGLGVTILSKWVVRKDVAWGTLKEISLGDVEPTMDFMTRQFSIVRRASAFQTKATEVFCEFLLERAARLDQFEV